MKAKAYLAAALLMFVASGDLLRAQSQTDMNMAAAADLEKADAILNRTYQAVLKKHSGDPAYCANLKEAQRAWLKFVELQLKCMFPLKEGENPREVYGSIYPLDYACAKTGLIEARTKQLKALLE